MATLAVRNEQDRIRNCLRHLVRNEIDFAIVDNGSTDATRSIVESAEFKHNLRDIHDVRFEGAFDHERMLIEQEVLIKEHECDWVIHLGADEIMHSYRPNETLRDAIAKIDADGWNAINFDEFVFLPVDTPYVPDHDGWQPLRYYYVRGYATPFLVRARKRNLNVSMIKYAGHFLDGEAVALSPERLALRHYIVRDQRHAFEKYATRVYAARSLARGWSKDKHGVPVEAFAFPRPEQLKFLPDPSSRDLDPSYPHATHYWLWGRTERNAESAGERVKSTKA
jgi:glycosyltransferase involved in cell wall biosynthesis